MSEEDHDGYFREWIVDKLLATRHAHRGYQGEKLTRWAKLLGVQEDVLVEAQAVHRLKQHEAGFQANLGMKVAGSAHCQYDVRVPPIIHRLWSEEAAHRTLKPSALLRSVIHAYLVGGWEPNEVIGHWRWEGVRVYPDGKRYRFRALITNGAHRALAIRGKRKHNKTPQAVVRALMIATLKNKFGVHGLLEVTDCESMYDDETRYYMGME